MSDEAAAGGLLHRRTLLKYAVAGSAGGFLVPASAAQDWMTQAGQPQGEYGEQSPYARLRREQTGGHPFGPAAGSSSTPLQELNGTITPNSLHFERHHSGIPSIDPDKHRLTISGEVERNLQFGYEDLLAYPKQSRLYFLECSGNGFRNTLSTAPDLTRMTCSG